MGQCIAKIAHSCGSSDGLQVFRQDDDSIDGYCYACDTYESDPLGGGGIESIPKDSKKPKTEEQIVEEMKEIADLGVHDLRSRKIRGSSLEYFGCKVGVSREDGKTPNIVFFPYREHGEVVKYKVRLLEPKSMWSVGLSNNVDLFGWDEAVASGARRLVITEGEFDAVALRRIMEMGAGKDYQDYIPAICSLPNGAGNAKRDLTRVMAKIKKHFKDISFCFDQDDAGLKAQDECCKMFPEATVINLPGKDANECLKSGKTKAVYKAVSFNSEKAKNTRLVWGSDLHEQAKIAPEWGLSWPWQWMTEKTRGIRFGETVYLGAGEKMGKSEVVNAIGAHLMIEHGLKIMLAKPEEANVKSYKMMAGKVAGKFFHDPSKEFDFDAFDDAREKIGDKLCMLNLYQNLSWEVLKADIIYAAGQGIKAVFIDPITNITNGMSTSDANTALQGIAQELATLAKDLDIVIFIFCHLNKPSKGNTPWDRGGKITTDYFAGSSAMARSCNYALGLQGNRDPDLDKIERNMRDLVILADREFGESGSCPLYWDDKTGLFNEA